MTFIPHSFDDSQIALRIAVRAALYTAVIFIVISIVDNIFKNSAYELWLDMILKSLGVMVALALTSSRINEAKQLSNPSNIPFLSTFFFYGTTLLLVYLGQIGYVVFQIFFGQPGNFTQTIQFLLGIHAFSVKAFVAAFLTGHLPYLIYFFNLRSRIVRLSKTTP